MRKLILLVLTITCLTNLAKATNYYLSSLSGDDSRTAQQASDPFTPWQSIDKLNAFNLSLKPGDSVFFKRGEVFYGSLVVKSSGTSANRIYYGAYGTGSNPVISGFTTLSGWTQYSGGIYYARLSVTGLLNMVTLNGEAKAMGRYPNTGFLKYEGNNANLSITDNELPASPNWTGGEIVMRKYRFILDRHTITSHNGTTLAYSTSTANGVNSAFNPVKGNGYFIQNHLSTLDQLGEWYYDAAAQRLYMHFGGGSPSSYVVKASSREYNGFVTTANFLTFENLAFEGGNTKGLWMTTTSNALVKNCQFENQGGSAFYAVDVSWINIQGGTVNTSFSNGINFDHNSNNCTVDGVYVANTNMIPGTSRSGTGISVGITVNGDGSKISNNQVYRSGYNGISFIGNNVVVEKNLVDTYCTLKDDGGGIYTYVGESNTTNSNRIIRNNIILNAIGAYKGAEAYYYEAFGKAAGIYLDEYVNNVQVLNNTVVNGDWAGIFEHNAHDNVISGNIFYNHRYQVLVSQYTAATRNNTTTNNQFVSKYAYQETYYYRTFVDDAPGNMGAFSNNYYARPIDDSKSIHCDFYQSGGAGTQYYTLDQWRASFGLDAGSKKSPIIYKGNIDDSLRVEYNATNAAKTVSLDGSYVDVKGGQYGGSVTLNPFTGVVLFKTKDASKLSQTITFPDVTGKTFGDAPFTLAATASSGLPVTYRYISGPATLSGSTVTLNGAGTVIIEASQAGNATYYAATPVNETFVVAKDDQKISFTDIADKKFGDAAFTISATASSGLPVSYRITSGPATLAGNTVTLTGIGNVTIEATQAGDSDYNAAPVVSQTFSVLNVAKQVQTISFSPIGNKTFNDDDFTLAATASSGLPVSYRVVSGPAAVSGNTVSLTGVGSVIIEASQAGNLTYNAATAVRQTFLVSKAVQNITFAGLADKLTSDQAFSLIATASSGLPVSFRIVSGPATLSGNLVSLTGATGTVTIEATQAGNSNYTAAAAVSQNFTVSTPASGAKLDQAITFPTLGYKRYNNPPFALAATASSGLPVSYRVASGPATISGNVVTLTGVGTVTIEASQSGNDIYDEAAIVAKSFTVGKAYQSITFPNPANKTLDDIPFTLAATASSGLPISYRVVSGPATVSGNLVTLTGTGTVVVEASQPGNENYVAAYSPQRSFTVAAGSGIVKQDQTIDFDPISDITLGDGSVTLTATASSGLPVSYEVISGPATVSGNIVTLTGVGTVIVEASQDGNANYLAATTQTQSFDVLAPNNDKQDQTISFGTLGYKRFDSPAFDLTATASSGLQVAYRIVSGPAVITGSTVSITGIGTVVIEASQIGNTNYNAAVPVQRSFTVGRASQTIDFPIIPNKTYGDEAFTLEATASSDLQVSYRVVSGPATVSGSIVTLTGAGVVIIEAAQPGNENYIAAYSPRRSFTVAPATASMPTIAPSTQRRVETTIAEVKTSVGVYPNPVRSSATISVTAAKAFTGTVEVLDVQGRLIQRFASRNFDKGTTTMSFDASQFIAGVYFVRVPSQEGIVSQKFQVVR